LAAEKESIPLIDKVWRYCDAHDIRPRTVTVKIKYADFKQVTRSRSTTSPISSAAIIREICQAILASEFPSDKGVRLLGVTLSSLERLAPKLQASSSTWDCKGINLEAIPKNSSSESWVWPAQAGGATAFLNQLRSRDS
jgi:hypothetical protein